MKKYLSLILEPNEIILWRGKPETKTLCVFTIFLIIVFLSISVLIFWQSNQLACLISELTTKDGACIKSLNILGFVFAILTFITPFVMYVYYRITEYGVTNKRILIRTGLIGADIRSLYFEQIRSIFINTSILGKLLGTGTILIDTGRLKKRTIKGSPVVYDKVVFL